MANARQTAYRSASGQRDGRRETLDRIARRRTSWATHRHSMRDAACVRCAMVYADHDLVLSPHGRVCEQCEGALEVARSGRIHAGSSARAAGLGLVALAALHGAFLVGTVSVWGLSWAGSLGGLVAAAEGLRYLARHRQLHTTAVRSEADSPPWWGAAAASTLVGSGLVSLVLALLL
ncbi:MAG: hypothetical protein ACI8PZ_000153 [Myxococcota bacterium]|jgi:hypothetical protein